jgi:hypothetical protein
LKHEHKNDAILAASIVNNQTIHLACKVMLIFMKKIFFVPILLTHLFIYLFIRMTFRFKAMTPVLAPRRTPVFRLVIETVGGCDAR